MNISETIRRGNITREFPGQYDVPALYLGSGDFGGCFDGTGFMNIPYQGRAHSNSVFMHADYYHRGKYGLHYHLPVMQLKLSSPETMRSGRQTLDLWDGRLTTESIYDGGRISLCARRSRPNGGMCSRSLLTMRRPVHCPKSDFAVFRRYRSIMARFSRAALS